MSLVVTAGNINDTQLLAEVLDGISVPTAGRARSRPDHLLADKGYSSKANRDMLRARKIPHTIPERDDQKNNRRARGQRGGRPAGFDGQAYKKRNVVERCFNKAKQWRGLATRYDKHAVNYLAGFQFAVVLTWADS